MSINIDSLKRIHTSMNENDVQCTVLGPDLYTTVNLETFNDYDEFESYIEALGCVDFSIIGVKNLPFKLEENSTSTIRRYFEINDINEHTIPKDEFHATADIVCEITDNDGDNTLYVNLETFDDSDDFYDFCERIYPNGYVFNDYENLPDGLKQFNDGIWDYLKASNAEKEFIEEYWDEIDSKETNIDYIIDQHVYCGSLKDYAATLIDENDEIPENLRPYFDYEKYSEDLEESYTETSNHVFMS